MFLCTCTNCGNVYEDTNPHPEDCVHYPDKHIKQFKIGTLPADGCTRCHTNRFIRHDLKMDAGGVAAQVGEHLLKKLSR